MYPQSEPRPPTTDVPSSPTGGDDAAALREKVRSRYAQAARSVRSGSCCAPASTTAPLRETPGCGCSSGAPAPAGKRSEAQCCAPDRAALGYDAAEIGRLPDDAVAASLGCGNPVALAELREGETVLDLGSGGGIDVLLSARRVGPTGFAYGVDMTDDMLDLSRENLRKSNLTNARFLRGTIEHIPLPPAAVDVVISNCVINLSTDKALTIREAYRVLRPGGRLAVADIVTTKPMPPSVRREVALWVGCVAGALTIDEYRALLAAAGFESIEIEPVGPEADDGVVRSAVATSGDLAAWDGRVLSAFVRARKPAAG